MGDSDVDSDAGSQSHRFGLQTYGALVGQYQSDSETDDGSQFNQPRPRAYKVFTQDDDGIDDISEHSSDDVSDSDVEGILSPEVKQIKKEKKRKKRKLEKL